MSSMSRFLLRVSLFACLCLAMTLGFGAAAQENAPAETKELPADFVTEPLTFIYYLTARDGMVFWGSPGCSAELSPPYPFVRSKPAADGPIYNIFDPGTPQPACQDSQIGSNLAVDDAYVYWINGQKQLLRQRRAAGPGEAPTVALNQVIAADAYGMVQVEGGYYYFLESSHPAGTGRMTRVPMAGGAPQVANFQAGAFAPYALKIDATGTAYYLHNGTLYRALPTGSTFSIEPVGAVGKVQSFTLDATTIYWVEKASSGSALLVRSAPLTNPTAAVTLYTIGGTNNPTVEAIAVNGNALFWKERRLVGTDRYANIVRLAHGTTAPSELAGYGPGDPEPFGLISSGRYLFWVLNEKIMRLEAGAAGLDLSAAEVGLEVVQAIQGPGNDVPLTIGKPTFVRVYARILPSSSNTPAIFVSPTVELHGTRNGVVLPGSPLKPVRDFGPITNATVDRRQFSNSALFRLPEEWANGTIQLNAVVNPRQTLIEPTASNNFANTTVTFQNVPTLCVVLVPVVTTSGTVTSRESLIPLFNRAASLWPLVEFDFAFDGIAPQSRPNIPFGIGGSSPYNLASDDEQSYLLWNLTWTYFNTGFACQGAGTVLAAPVSSAGRFGMASSFSNVVFFTTTSGGAPVNAPIAGVSGVAHELAHSLGRYHVNCGGAGWPWSYPPYPACQLDFSGPMQHVGLDSITQQLIAPEAAADFMSYFSGTLWTSDYTYIGLRNWLRGTRQREDRSGEATAAGDKLLVSGVLTPNPIIGYTVRLSGTLLAAAEQKVTDGTVPSLDYRLRFYDDTGQLIDEQPLHVMTVEAEGGPETRFFFHLIPADPVPARLEVAQVGGPIVLSRDGGSAAPEVTITSPGAGTSVGTQLNIAWTATDADDDPLLYTVRYSPDNGATWHSFGPMQAENFLSVNLDDGLPGGSQTLVQVVVSDGVHSAQATAGPFITPRHAPQVAIVDAGGNVLGDDRPAGMLQSETMTLRADAFDPEDRTLSGSALAWHVHGPVDRSGAGRELFLTDLPPGTYRATLTATDSDGQDGTAEADLVVTPKRISDSHSGPLLDGFCDDEAYGVEPDPLTLRYDDQAFAEVRFVRSGGYLFACFSGLALSSHADSAAGLRIDSDHSASPLVAAGDMAFFVRKNGLTFTAAGDGAGGFVTDPVPVGLAAAVNHEPNGWSAELRIDAARLGDWNRLIGMRAGHYWRNFVGDGTAWPVGSAYDSPATWGATALGALDQSIQFAALPDRPATDAPFNVSATASSGLPVMFEGAGACEVNGQLVTLTGIGVCTVTAVQPGNATYDAAIPVSRSFVASARLFLPVASR